MTKISLNVCNETLISSKVKLMLVKISKIKLVKLVNRNDKHIVAKG